MAHAKAFDEDNAEQTPPPLTRVRFRPRNRSTSEGGPHAYNNSKAAERRADSSSSGMRMAGQLGQARTGQADVDTASPRQTDGTGSTSSESGPDVPTTRSSHGQGGSKVAPSKREAAAAAMAHSPVASVNFTGDYEIDYRPHRSQSPDAQMEALGFYYFSASRVAARTFWMAMTVTIEHDPAAQPFPTWQETVQAGVVYSSTEDLRLDGVARRTTKQGFEVEVTTLVEDGGDAVVTRIKYLQKPGYFTEIRRTLIAHDPQNYNDKTYKCVNTLKRPGALPLTRESYYVLSR